MTVAGSTMTVDDVMVDHPAWVMAEDGTMYRAVRSGESVWSATCTPPRRQRRRVRLTRLTGTGPTPLLDVCDPADLASLHPAATALSQAGPIARLRNPDLWDALGTSIIRQVIRAGQARKLYLSFCEAYGRPAVTSAGQVWLFPKPDVVVSLSDDQFARLGMAFKAPPLRAAADAFLQYGQKWSELDVTQLVTDVQMVPRIGPWTAGATAADFSNDFSLYPFADLAVRTWAARLVPGLSWPETEPAFAQAWQALAGPQLSAWTLLTLAYGGHHASRTGDPTV